MRVLVDTRNRVLEGEEDGRRENEERGDGNPV